MAVDAWLPKTYGLLGIAYYRAGHKERARAATSRAKELCARVDDREGVRIYAANLELIEQGHRLVFRDAQGRSADSRRNTSCHGESAVTSFT